MALKDTIGVLFLAAVCTVCLSFVAVPQSHASDKARFSAAIFANGFYAHPDLCLLVREGDENDFCRSRTVSADRMYRSTPYHGWLEMRRKIRRMGGRLLDSCTQSAERRFECDGFVDWNAAQMRRALVSVATRLAEDNTEASKTLFLYFQAHGVNAFGYNWLLPVDACADRTSYDRDALAAHLSQKAVSVSEVLAILRATPDRLSRLKIPGREGFLSVTADEILKPDPVSAPVSLNENSDRNIVMIIEACRSNTVCGLDSTAGARIGPLRLAAPNVMYVLSTSPGFQAQTRLETVNGRRAERALFTSHLLDYIQYRDNLTSILRRTQETMDSDIESDRTLHRQEAWIQSSMSERLWLSGVYVLP